MITYTRTIKDTPDRGSVSVERVRAAIRRIIRTKRARRLRRAFLLLPLLLVACADPAAPTLPPEPEPLPAYLQLHNTFPDDTVTALVAGNERAPSDSNRLSAPIVPGASAVVVLAPECYDVIAATAQHRFLFWLGVCLRAGQVVELRTK